MVSIIIPVYNAERTLNDCVASVLRQTYSDYELILVDDGSKDRSGQLCDEIQAMCIEQGVRCQVIHQPNGGVSKARNVGMEHVNGKYFVCIDSDDVVEPCYLEDLVHTTEAHPEFGHVVCGFRCTSDGRGYIFTDRELLSVVDRKEYMDLHKATLILAPWLGLYRTNIVRQYHLKMPEDMNLGEDLLFNLSYLDVIPKTIIGVINKTNYVYKDNDQNSLNHRYRSDLLSVNERILEAIKMYMKKWNIIDTFSWEQYFNLAFYRYTNTMKNTFSEHNPMTVSQKIEFNNLILTSEQFQEALDNMKISLSPGLNKAFRSGDYRNVMKAERHQQVKETIARVIHKFRYYSGD